MSFSPEAFRSRLAASNETAESITSTAQWILFHKRHAGAVAEQWAQAVSEDNNKLPEIYIANEVIQQSKIKRKTEFVDAFARVMPDALKAAHAESDLPTRDRIARVVRVWRERSVFTPEVQADIEDSLNTSGGGTIPADLQPLSQRYVALLTQLKKDRGGDLNRFFDDVQAEIKALEARLYAMKESRPFRIASPEVEPLSPEKGASPAPTTTAKVTQPEPEPEVYTAEAAQASISQDGGEVDVGYASSSDEADSGDGPPEKKQKLEVDPKLASFLASLTKTTQA